MEEKQKVERQRCKKCNSTFTYVRFRDKSRVCRNCGNIEKLEENKEGETIDG